MHACLCLAPNASKQIQLYLLTCDAISCYSFGGEILQTGFQQFACSAVRFGCMWNSITLLFGYSVMQVAQ